MSFEDIGDVLEEVGDPDTPLLEKPRIVPGTKVFYETGPCTITLIDEEWSMVQVDENGKLVWLHRSLITRMS